MRAIKVSRGPVESMSPHSQHYAELQRPQLQLQFSFIHIILSNSDVFDPDFFSSLQFYLSLYFVLSPPPLFPFLFVSPHLTRSAQSVRKSRAPKAPNTLQILSKANSHILSNSLVPSIYHDILINPTHRIPIFALLHNLSCARSLTL